MTAKDTFFKTKRSLVIDGKLCTFDRPLVMGILNITDDSFYDKGRFSDLEKAIDQFDKLIEEGAEIIDIGAQSTRPGFELSNEKEETTKVVSLLGALGQERLKKAFISVDTFRAEVASQALKAGAHIINDISAGEFDSKMFKVVSDAQCPYIIMHQNGSLRNLHKKVVYRNVVEETISFLKRKANELHRVGVYDVVIDPGFGFSKSLDGNYRLFTNLEALNIIGLPILVGVSRKSMVTKIIERPSAEALAGTSALHLTALLNGASVLRVHDVAEAVDVVRIYEKLKSTSSP